MILSWLYIFKTTKDTNKKCHQLKWCILSTPIKPVTCVQCVSVQSQASNGKNWVRMTEIWPLELSNVYFNWLSEFNKKTESVNEFLGHLRHFLMSIFLTNKFQLCLTSLFSVIFAKLVLKMLPILLCTNIL